MRRRLSLMSITLALLAGTVIAVWPRGAAMGVAEDQAPDRDGGPFEGMYLYVISESEHTTGLKDARVDRLGQTDFLVGAGLDPFGLNLDWREDSIIWIRVDTIEQIVVFDDLELMKERFTGVEF